MCGSILLSLLADCSAVAELTGFRFEVLVECTQAAVIVVEKWSGQVLHTTSQLQTHCEPAMGLWHCAHHICFAGAKKSKGKVEDLACPAGQVKQVRV